MAGGPRTGGCAPRARCAPAGGKSRGSGRSQSAPSSCSSQCVHASSALGPSSAAPRVRAKAAYDASGSSPGPSMSSRRSRDIDARSATAWWRQSTMTCRSGPRRRMRSRTSGPSARSKGAVASRASASSTCPSLQPPASSTTVMGAAAARTRTTGRPPMTGKQERRIGWRATASCSRATKPSGSKGPTTSTANGRW